ncbi:MAG: 50S ribosomal protein L13 [Planctomycetota bacterium]|nr:50S ribosomal protein L13 [Planctomycetota bacterium]
MTKTTLATTEDRAKAMDTWHVVDASQYVLGKMAVAIAEILMGKNKPLYTPHMQVGDGVIVINAEKVQVTGNKRAGRMYRFYSGWPGGLKEASMQDLLDNKPAELIKLSVRRMLPKNRLARDMLSRLKAYAGPDHPHGAQNPSELKLDV